MSGFRFTAHGIQRAAQRSIRQDTALLVAALGEVDGDGRARLRRSERQDAIAEHGAAIIALQREADGLRHLIRQCPANDHSTAVQAALLAAWLQDIEAEIRAARRGRHAAETSGGVVAVVRDDSIITAWRSHHAV